MTAFNHPILWGPGSNWLNINAGTATTFSGYPLNDADDSIAIVAIAPKDGTINAVGCYVTAITGNPPGYYFGVVTVDTGTGNPNTAAYGGSAIETYDFTAAGWVWVTLSTPATAQAGDLFAVRIWPTATAPDAGNSATIAYDNILRSSMPYENQYTTGWTKKELSTAMAARYSTGEIVGFPAVGFLFGNVDTGTTPDEVGCKFVLPFTGKCSGAVVSYRGMGANASHIVKLYDASNTLLGSSVALETEVGDANGRKFVYWDEATLTSGETYRITILPQNTNDTYVAAFDFESEASKSYTLPDGANWQATSRTDAGAWTDDASGIVLIALIITDITFSAASTAGAYGFAA